MHWKGCIDLENKRLVEDAGDHRYVSEKIETKILVHCGVHDVAGGSRKQRIAIRRRTNDCLGRYIAGRAGPVLDNKLLAEAFRKPLRNEARSDGRGATGREADENTH